MKVAIIGGGLAGCAAAYVLKQAGHDPVIYEAADTLAAGASGNTLGLYNPRLSAEFSPQAQYYAYGFDVAREVFASVKGIDWNPCGALHLITDEKKDIRFRKMAESWPDSGMVLLSAAEASEVAGVELSHEALYLSDSGYVSPRKLCEAYAQGVEVNLNAYITSLEEIEADAIILACAGAVNDFAPDLPLQNIRGQVTHVKSEGEFANLETCLCYGGYTTPALEGVHMVGSTFQRWLDHSDIIEEDDQDNIAKLIDAAPSLEMDFEITGHRAAIRTASKDQFPVVGALPDTPNVYVSTAHGSHGIVSSIAAARYLLSRIKKLSSTFSDDVTEYLMPSRFL